MAPDDNEPNDPDDPDDRERVDPTFGLRAGLSAFADLLRALDEEGERRGSGRIEGDRANIDYDVNIGTGPGPGDRKGSPRRSSGSPRKRRRRKRASDDDYLVTTRETDDGIAVTADLPGVDDDDLTVGFEDDDETLVVAVDGEVVERVSLPWPAEPEKSTFRNGVLEIHLREEE